MAILVDTDVFSMLFKGDSRGERFAALLQARTLHISFMSVAELYRWSISRNWGDARRRSLDQVLRYYTVLPYDAQLAEHWARISVHRARAGAPISCGDCWIAACATRYQLPLATNNAKDFAGIDELQLLIR